MRLKAPKFWQSDNFISRILIPFSWIYGFGSKIKFAKAKPYHSSIPVLCIGGVVAGGSGKSPVLQAILKLLVENNLYQKPVILMRGYGGQNKGPVIVNPDNHTSYDVGDEAMMHAEYANVIVSSNRADGAMMSEMMGADIILMDDGLQNTDLHKDISFLVIDSVYGLGNGRIIPAGPLREPYKRALAKCAAIIETGGASLKDAIKTNIRIVSSHDKTKHYFGFAGLGRPEKFKETLKTNGFLLSGFQSFPDHHPYNEHDIELLMKQAKKSRLITTQKDFVKIPDVYKPMVDTVIIELMFNEPQEIIDLIQQ